MALVVRVPYVGCTHAVIHSHLEPRVDVLSVVMAVVPKVARRPQNPHKPATQEPFADRLHHGYIRGAKYCTFNQLAIHGITVLTTKPKPSLSPPL